MAKTRQCGVPASYLVLIRDNKTLLLRRFNTGYRDGNYSLVAGHVDPKETFTQCIVREAKEEAGIILRAKDLDVAHIMHRNAESSESDERIDLFFVARQWLGEIVNQEPHKCDDLRWFDLDNLPANTIPYIAQALHKIKNKVFYSEHGW
jgi:8-oxo-dGTP diphosphatase